MTFLKLVIDSIEGLDIATQTPPTSVDGGFLLAMNNAQALVSLGAMFSPEIAGLNLQSDGTVLPTGTAEAFLYVHVPTSVADAPAGSVPVMIFGHGIFGEPQIYLDEERDDVVENVEAMFAAAYEFGQLS